jgi:N-acetylmuramoyl-L-alanine amidase
MASMQSKSAVFSSLAFFVVAFYCLTYANVTVKWEESGNEKTLAPLSSEGTGFVSIKEFFGLLDFTSRWNKTAAKLTCVKGEQKIVFCEDIPFCSINNSYRQLPCAPLMEETHLFLPVWIAVSLASDIEKVRMEWDEADSTIIIGDTQAVMTDIPEKNKEVRAVRTSVSQSPDVKGEPVGPRQLIKTIVIDPGHGGKDPGAIGPDGTREKDIVLSVGLKLRDMLKKKSIFPFT